MKLSIHQLSWPNSTEMPPGPPVTAAQGENAHHLAKCGPREIMTAGSHRRKAEERGSRAANKGRDYHSHYLPTSKIELHDVRHDHIRQQGSFLSRAVRSWRDGRRHTGARNRQQACRRE